MQRRRPRLLATASIFVAMGVLLPATLGALKQPAELTRDVVVTPLGGSAFLLAVADSAGVTNLLASIGDDGALLVDHPGNWRTRAPDRAQAGAIREALDVVRRVPLRFIVNTHAHGDHSGGNELYGNVATIIAHTNARSAMLRSEMTFGVEVPRIAAVGVPTVTVDDSLTLHLNGETVRLLHFGPAHTDGDLVVFFERADVVHMGDLYHGVDLPTAGDILGLARSYEAVLRRIGDDTRVITGHGHIESNASLATLSAFLRAGIDSVRARSQRGLSLAEITRIGIPGRDAERMRPEVRDRLLARIHRAL